MPIKSDKWIRRMAQEHGMIFPFEPKQVRNNDYGRMISSGVSSYGYDVRCGRDFKIFSNINNSMVDPKNFDDGAFICHHGKNCIIPPNSFCLARTIEQFRIPRNALCILIGKSTYERCGIKVSATALEPEYEGFATLMISNATPLPSKVYADEGIAQLLFLESDEDCEVSYRDRKGKYQNEYQITPKV